MLADVADVYEPVAEEAGDRLVSTVAIAERAQVTGDRELLTQLFANLIENAIRHSPKGTRIDVSLATRGERHIAVVADSGPGIPAHECENVFRRLYRLERERMSPGSGLGLSLVAAIAELHGAGVDPQRQHARACVSRCPSRAREHAPTPNKKVQCTGHCTKSGGASRRSSGSGGGDGSTSSGGGAGAAPAGLADDRGMRGSGSCDSHAGDGGLAGGCSKAQDDGAADERQRNDALH